MKNSDLYSAEEQKTMFNCVLKIKLSAVENINEDLFETSRILTADFLKINMKHIFIIGIDENNITHVNNSFLSHWDRVAALQEALFINACNFHGIERNYDNV